jgi:uncharacterized glyoxalase superfamily protein PhnB
LCPPDEPNFEIVLVKASTPEEKSLIGKQAAQRPLCVFATKDCRKTYQELSQRGIKFTQEPTEQFWGIEALCIDPFGNILDIVQPS